MLQVVRFVRLYPRAYGLQHWTLLLVISEMERTPRHPDSDAPVGFSDSADYVESFRSQCADL